MSRERSQKFPIKLLLVFTIKIVECLEVQKFSFLMPNVRPTTPESYLCTPVKIDVSKTFYVIGFEPNATMHTAHHMLLYGCSKPGTANSIWDCGEMSNSRDPTVESASPCAEDQEIIYAWARDAPPLILPAGVGFKIGKGSTIKYLVLQVHYAHVEHFKDGRTDDSGVSLQVTEAPLKKLAGIVVLGTGGMIPPQSVEYMETSCKINENKTIHPFAYRVHTHGLGKVVAGYVIKNNNRWIELGKRDPLTPQMFYKVNNNVSVSLDDTLAARCTMQSERDDWTLIGNTNKDEMCNFYIMYYVNNGEPLKTKFCFMPGPPYDSWEKEGLRGIPDTDASTLY